MDDSSQDHICPRCGAVYGTKAALASHVSSHMTGAPTDPFVCLECGASFESREAMEEHNRVHGETTAGARAA